MENLDLIGLTASIAAAYVTNNATAVTDLPRLIADTHGALASLGEDLPPVSTKQEPAVSIRSSVKPDYIISLEDGTRHKMLKRHLTNLGMTPDDYRRKWGLPGSYPMVSPNYSKQRAELARKIGLGTKANRGR